MRQGAGLRQQRLVLAPPYPPPLEPEYPAPPHHGRRHVQARERLHLLHQGRPDHPLAVLATGGRPPWHPPKVVPAGGFRPRLAVDDDAVALGRDTYHLPPRRQPSARRERGGERVILAAGQYPAQRLVVGGTGGPAR